MVREQQEMSNNRGRSANLDGVSQSFQTSPCLSLYPEEWHLGMLGISLVGNTV